jgi:hypothetical protein
MIQTPVAFLIFKRPDVTAKVFEAIRQAQPSKLLVIADGPREDRPGEAEKCEATRAIIEQVDWPCEVLKNYSDKNLGCKRRVASGLSWVFETVEEAIILEDDCLPHPSFFPFCEELLDHYRHDERIFAISGDNSRDRHPRNLDSYHFTRLTPIWGWATWRRAWQTYDVTIKHWPKLQQEGWLRDVWQSQKVVQSWEANFRGVYENRVDTWDYQWTFNCWAQGGLYVVPNVNLISNLGFAEDATHTKNVQDKRANFPMEDVRFPLQHPTFIIPDFRRDELDFISDIPTISARIYRKMRKFFPLNIG